MSSNRASLRAMAVGNFAIGMGALIIAGIIQPMAADFAVGLSAIGRLVTIYALAYALGSPLLIALTGTMPRKYVLLLALGAVVIGNVIGATAGSYAMAFASRIVVALGAALFTPVASGVASALSAPEDRGKAIAFVFAGFAASTALGIPVGTYIGLEFGWRWSLGLVALLGLVGGTAVFLTLPKEIASPSVELKTMWHILRQFSFIIILFITTLQIGSQLIVYTFITPLLQQYLGIAATGLTLILFSFGVASFVGNLIGGYGADKIGARQTLLVLLVGLTLVLFGLPLMNGSLAMGILITLLWGIVGFGFQAPQQVRLIALDPKAQNAVLSLNASAIYLGTASGSYLGGVIYDSSGLANLTWIGGIIAAVSLLILLLSWSAERRRAVLVVGD